MSTFWIVTGLAVIALLIGFIVLQRRRASEADKIASALDSAAKTVEQKARDAFTKK